jgi:kallikrein
MEYKEYNAERIILHPKFNNQSLQNTIAIIRLRRDVPLGRFPTITTACLADVPINKPGLRCLISGWGRNDFNYGTNQAIQRKTDVPLVSSESCQKTLRMTKLGKKFVLDPGFLCAGGEEGKDAVSSDSINK